MKIILSISLLLLASCKQNSQTAAQKKDVFIVTAPALMLRDAPALTGKTVAVLPKGIPVLLEERTTIQTTYQGVTAAWFRVSQLGPIGTTGTSGFAFSSFLQQTSIVEELPKESSKQSLCASATDLHSCWRSSESSVIQEHPEIFSRNGKSLTIRAATGTPIVYTDNDGPNAGDAVQVHYLNSYDQATGCAFVQVVYYEGGATFLVHIRTGTTLRLWLMPDLSPDQKTYTVVSQSVAYIPSGIQVIDISGEKPFIVLSVVNPGWLATDLRWEKPDLAAFSKVYYVPSSGYVIVPAFLRNIRNKWSIE